MKSTAHRMISAQRLAAATATTWLLLASAALSAEAVQPLRAAGMEIFYGLIPAEIVLGHPDDHPERRVHGGAPAWGEQIHLIVTLFDQGSGKRIHDAEINVTVFDVRVPGKRVGGPRKPLEPMQVAGAAAYGNYFNMPAPVPYRIELETSESQLRVLASPPLTRIYQEGAADEPRPSRWKR